MTLENKPELVNFYCPNHDDKPTSFEFADRNESARNCFFRCKGYKQDGERCGGLYHLYYLMQYTVMRRDEIKLEIAGRK